MDLENADQRFLGELRVRGVSNSDFWTAASNSKIMDAVAELVGSPSRGLRIEELWNRPSPAQLRVRNALQKNFTYVSEFRTKTKADLVSEVRGLGPRGVMLLQNALARHEQSLREE